MRGPIQAPILLPFGNRNTQAEPHRALPCANKRGQQRHARSILDRSLPCLPCPSIPRFAEPRRACDGVHRQAFLASPAVPYPSRPCHACRAAPDVPRQISPCQPRLSRPRLSLPAIPCLPIPAFLAMPAVRCRASIAPDLATPCLPTPPFNATSCHACQSGPGPATTALPAEPVLPRLVMPAAPCHTRPSHAPVTSPAMPRQRCPRGLARRALP
jgi:hypothetical protein